MLHHGSSFLRKQESSEKTFFIRGLVGYWVPVFIGMALGLHHYQFLIPNS